MSCALELRTEITVVNCQNPVDILPLTYRITEHSLITVLRFHVLFLVWLCFAAVGIFQEADMITQHYE